MNEFWANREFERLLCEYTGAPRAIVVDNACNALFLCLRYIDHSQHPAGIERNVSIPRNTFIGVPYAIKAAGFTPVGVGNPAEGGFLQGPYQLHPFPIWDSALRLTSGMYQKGQFMCLSFTGPYKHLKLQKGGAILLDDEYAETWLRRASYCGRNYVSYHEDTFTMPEGYNHYMPPVIATLGVQFIKGLPLDNPDLRLPYPDWSVHPAFQ